MAVLQYVYTRLIVQVRGSPGPTGYPLKHRAGITAHLVAELPAPRLDNEHSLLPPARARITVRTLKPLIISEIHAKHESAPTTAPKSPIFVARRPETLMRPRGIQYSIISPANPALLI